MPEEEPSEVYPYRRVWETTWFKITVDKLGCRAHLRGHVCSTLYQETPATLAAALREALRRWRVAGVSYRSERCAVEPRQHILSVLILGAGRARPPSRSPTPVRAGLAAGAGIFGRVLGYTFTLGFTAVFLKYTVLRYTV